MLPTKVQFIWQSGFRGEDFLEINQSETRMACGGHIVNESGRNEQSLQRISHRCCLPSFISFSQAVSEEKLFQKSTNKKQELPMTTMFVNRSKLNEQLPQRTFHGCFLPRFGPFRQAVSEQKIFRNRPIRNKNCLWWPCLLMDQDKMSNLYREPAIDASYQVSVHLGKRFQRRFFRNQPIRNKNYLWWPCLLMDQDEMSISTEDFPQMFPTKFRFIWPNGFRGEESKKSANQKQESHVAATFVNGSRRNEQSLQRTFHRCFLPSFISFCQAVSEEKLFQKSTNEKQKLPMTAMFAIVNGSKWNE